MVYNDVVAANDNTLYVSEYPFYAGSGTNRIVRFDVSTGQQTIIAGGPVGARDGVGTNARFGYITSIQPDKKPDPEYLYISDSVITEFIFDDSTRDDFHTPGKRCDKAA
mmetsp:Transcript_3130/g.4528  ORF Transcript_3130/g.4528 Transcript_3130/m.4528 type:complete len:109 (+) Transcript_3130:75-401(+)